MTGSERNTDADRETDAQDALWSLLAASLPPQAPPPELRSNLIAALRGKERWAPFASEIARVFGLPLEVARAALARITDPSAWQPAFWPGSWISSTEALQRARTVFARLPAATRIPLHRHPGRELTYVLDGELIEEGGRRLGPGELLEMSAGSEHAITVGEAEECLVVFSLPPG